VRRFVVYKEPPDNRGYCRYITMTFIELYSIGVPLFVPTVELLVEWHMTQHLVTYITWSNVTRAGDGRPSQPFATNRKDREALLHWFRFNQPYQMPHVQQFASVPDLFLRLRTADFGSISRAMRMHTTKRIRRAASQWLAIMLNVMSHSPSHHARQVPTTTYADAMEAVYGSAAYSTVNRHDVEVPCHRERTMEAQDATDL
jgi:hypothetical protein